MICIVHAYQFRYQKGVVLKARVNLSLDKEIPEAAQALGLNMSRIAEEAISEAIRDARNRQWIEENQTRLDAYTEEIEREGPALAKYRTF